MEFPFSLQDAAKALREVFRLLDDFAKRGGKVAKFLRERQRRKAAALLDELRFKEGGSVTILRSVASGHYEKEDIDALRAQMGTTSQGISEAIRLLGDYKRALREQLSIEALILLENIVEGEDGKMSTRQLINMVCIHTDRGDTREAQVAAGRALQKIETLNKNIIDLHNALILGRKVKNEAKRRKRATPKKQKAASA